MNLLPSTLTAAAIFLAALAHAAPPSTPPTLLELADDKLLAEVLYKQPKRLLDNVSESGAVSVNAKFEAGQQSEWFVEQQRGGADWVQAGVVLKDKALIEKGIKVINWGFARQGPGGDFPGTGDPLHSTSFFVEAASRATILLAYSRDPAWQAQVKEWVPKIKAAAQWMTQPEVAQKGRDKNLEPYTHRFYLRAAALGEAAAVTRDQGLADAAIAYAREGLAKQQPDGVNPEKGGFDVSYQAVGVAFALRFLSVCGDAAVREELKTMARKSLDNALTKVGPDGAVSLEGSARTGVEESRSGKAKTLDYKNFLQGLTSGERILGEVKYRQAAELIAKAWK